jgi:putative zinc finger/helix-turn-helix YgiT family protein
MMKNSKPVCRECGGKASLVRKDYRFTESGLDNVVLKDIEVVVCPQCGSESPRIPNHDDLMRTIAIALIDMPSELSGNEVRFLRKLLGRSGEQFAQMLGIDRSHLSRIENGAMAVSRQTDRLVRTLALIHQPALLDKLKQIGRYEVILEHLSAIHPEANPVEVQLGRVENGYTYNLKVAA